MNRASIKERAKSMFTGCYWPHVGIFAIISVIAGGASGLSTMSSYTINFTNTGVNNLDIPAQFAPIFAAIALFAGIIGIAYSIFVAGPVSISAAKIGLNAYRGERPDFANLLYCVKGGRYWKCVGTSALHILFVSLAAIAVTLVSVILGAILIAVAAVASEGDSSEFARGAAILFAVIVMTASLIPTIIVSAGLSQVPYVAADEGVYGMDAIRRSWNMMRGHKWERFVFELSFIGWELLVGLTFGVVGIFYAGPYMSISFAGYNHELTAGGRTPETEEAAVAEQIL